MLWRCPVCGGKLQEEEKGGVCPKGHRFDKARSGYLNLLPPSGKKTREPGDNKEMIRARWAFLQKGYYIPLADLAGEITLGEGKTPLRMLDAGCGEGYYSQRLWEKARESGRELEIYGMDISKFAVDRAAKGLKQGRYAVGSLYHLPLGEESVDVIWNFFAPHCPEEFARVLEKNGRLLVAVPGKRHLWELKERLYDEPYENPGSAPHLPGFLLEETRPVTYPMALSGEDVWSLFQMTPYFYKTDPQRREVLSQVQGMEITADFLLLCYRKEEG